jgi:hypothetical protein
MSNYVKATDFASKDALTSGDPLKLIKGTEINTEFNAIQTAVATKADLASPAFTGNPTATTQATGNSSTRLATTAFVNNQIAANASSVAITGGTIDGVAITGGTVSGLATDLAVADGGTGASTFTLNSVVLGNNTSSLAGNMVAPGTSGNVLTSNGTTWTSAVIPENGIGVGQAWQDVKASRAFNTTYTNNTGKPIQVWCTVVGGTSPNFGFNLNGIGTLLFNGNSGQVTSGYVIVPNGHTYRLDSLAGANTIQTWAELR